MGSERRLVCAEALEEMGKALRSEGVTALSVSAGDDAAELVEWGARELRASVDKSQLSNPAFLAAVDLRDGARDGPHKQLGREVEDAARDPWAHRSAGMRCRSCMWFAAKGSLGRCRRRAPTMGGYPVVTREDWCGDHKLDEGSAGG